MASSSAPLLSNPLAERLRNGELGLTLMIRQGRSA